MIFTRSVELITGLPSGPLPWRSAAAISWNGNFNGSAISLSVLPAERLSSISSCFFCSYALRLLDARACRAPDP